MKYVVLEVVGDSGEPRFRRFDKEDGYCQFGREANWIKLAKPLGWQGPHEVESKEESLKRFFKEHVGCVGETNDPSIEDYFRD